MTSGLTGLSGLSGLISPALAPGISITDSFTGADGTDINGKATETGGKTWTVLPVGGVLRLNIQSNAVSTTTTGGGGSGTLAYVDAAVADGTVSSKVLASTDAQTIFRLTDVNNWIMAGRNSGNSVVYKFVAGSYFQIGSNVAGAAANDVYQVIMSGTSIIVKRNGIQIFSFTESFNSTATKHGFRASPTSTASIDDFSFTSP